MYFIKVVILLVWDAYSNVSVTNDVSPQFFHINRMFDNCRTKWDENTIPLLFPLLLEGSKPGIKVVIIVYYLRRSSDKVITK